MEILNLSLLCSIVDNLLRYFRSGNLSNEAAKVLATG